DFESGLVAFDLFALEPAQAVFGRDRAVVAADHVVNDLGAFLPAADEGGDVLADARQDVVVQIAVADVAEDRDAATGVKAFDRGRGLVDIVGDAADRHRDVVFPAAAL